MNFLSSLLGKLPASDSGSWTLNGLDVQKTLRLAIVVFLGAFSMKISAVGGIEVLVDMLFANPNALLMVLKEAGSAGVMALGSAVVELIRRFVSNQI